MRNSANGMSGRLTDWLEQNRIIERKDRDLYQYCINGMFEMGANILLTLIIGLIFKSFAQTIIFLAIIIPLRSTAGGYHADKSSTCFIFSMAIYIVCLLASKYFTAASLILTVMFFVCGVAIFMLTPVDSAGKRLDRDEKRAQKLRTAILIPIYTVAFVIFYFLSQFSICTVFSFSFILIFILQIFGILKNMHEKITVQ